MNTKPCILLCCILLLEFTGSAMNLTVSKDGGAAYKSIQKAIDAASAADTVTITDNAIYEEQVTIDSTKSNLTLRSSNPKALSKPVIKWTDTVNVHPKTWDETKDEKTVNFYLNGALRLLNVRGVIVNGIKVDGGKRFPFGYPGIWNRKDPLFHGNAALVLWRSGDAIVKNCEFVNAYFGICIDDQNLGGIYANANPADIQPWQVIPLSGFDKTGNHLIEYNRIHDNSWGLFFDCTWNLGSTFRYNLFYENHHDDSTAVLLTTTLKSYEGQNHPGGAILFKDIMLTPLAIYNNTFWHNYVELGAHWRGGTQHLLFNNIFAEPYEYYITNKTFPNPYATIDTKFANRMHNCIYACHQKAPGRRAITYKDSMVDPDKNTYVYAESTFTCNDDQIRIMNGLTTPQVSGANFDLIFNLSGGIAKKTVTLEWVVLPGAIMLDFPEEASVRWYEIKFKSYDPSSPDFLTPDWNDSLVKELVLDKGWDGTVDRDGTPADLGAFPRCGILENDYIIKPVLPVQISGAKAKIIFSLNTLHGDISSPSVVKINWIKDVPFQANAFGSGVKELAATNIIALDLTQNIVNGVNQIEFPIPERTESQIYAFLEIIIKGKNSNGETVLSNTGFIPYRSLPEWCTIELWNLNETSQISDVHVNETFKMKIFNNRAIRNLSVSLAEPGILRGESGNTLDFPDEITGNKTFTVSIDRRGSNLIQVFGVNDSLPVFGSSPVINVLPDETVVLKPGKSGNGISTGNKMYRIFDLKGKLIGKYTFSMIHRTNLSRVNGQLSSGLYFIEETDLISGKIRYSRVIDVCAKKERIR